MEIKLSHNLAPMSRLATVAAHAQPANPTADGAAFNRAQALNDAFEALPGVRAEVVARAQALVADPTYPPSETIQRIASLLALHLEGEAK